MKIFDLGHDLVDIIFPKVCMGCENLLYQTEEFLCSNCFLNLPIAKWENTPKNPVYQVFRGKLPVEHATSYILFNKKSFVRKILHQMKYGGQPELGEYLGKFMGQKLLTYPWIDDVDVIVPVPLHAKKLELRGYNQAEVLAKGISSICQKKVVSQALKRTRFTKTQTLKSRIERILNLSEAFQSGKFKKPRHILLVDDVITTGSTLEACASAILERNPHCRVSFASLAFAE